MGLNRDEVIRQLARKAEELFGDGVGRVQFRAEVVEKAKQPPHHERLWRHGLTRTEVECARVDLLDFGGGEPLDGHHRDAEDQAQAQLLPIALRRRGQRGERLQAAAGQRRRFVMRRAMRGVARPPAAGT